MTPYTALLSSASAVCSSVKLYTLHIHKNRPESGPGAGEVLVSVT